MPCEKIKKKILKGFRNPTCIVAYKGIPEPLYGFHSGKFNCPKISLARTLKGNICLKTSSPIGFCAMVIAPFLKKSVFHGSNHASKKSPGNGYSPYRKNFQKMEIETIKRKKIASKFFLFCFAIRKKIFN